MLPLPLHPTLSPLIFIWTLSSVTLFPLSYLLAYPLLLTNNSDSPLTTIHWLPNTHSTFAKYGKKVIIDADEEINVDNTIPALDSSKIFHDILNK